jgi:hypothetical protein
LLSKKRKESELLLFAACLLKYLAGFMLRTTGKRLDRSFTYSLRLIPFSFSFSR